MGPVTAAAVGAALALAVLWLAGRRRSRCPLCGRRWSPRHLGREAVRVERSRGKAPASQATYARVEECRHCGAVLLWGEVEEPEGPEP